MAHKAYDKISGSLAIVSTAHEGKLSGCIINSVLLAAGGKIVISVSKDNFTCGEIGKSGLFTVALLTQEVQGQVIADFGFKSSAQLNKFASWAFVKDKKGVPCLTQDVAARFACRVSEQLDLNSHILFIGTVYEVEARSEVPVMTTEYYKTQKEGQVPSAAPSHTTGEPGWRCSVCGYILESEEIPDDFKCPICGRGPNMLVKR